MSENGGTAVGTVLLTTPLTTNLIVALASSDPAEAVVPDDVTILAGESSATFAISGVDETIDDGDSVVTISASSALNADSLEIVVTDDDLTPVWIDLAFEDFEAGFGTYPDGGNDARLYRGGTLSHQGSNSANLQDNSGAASSIELTDGLDLASPEYTRLKVDFWFQAVSFESNEDFWLQYSDGNGWQTIGVWTVGTNFQNNEFNFASVEVSDQDVAFSSNAKIRFVADASNNGDDVYLDEIRIQGFGIPPANQSPTALNDLATTTQDTDVVVSVLANDSDPDNDPLVIDSFSQGASGSVSDNGDGTLMYAPNAGFIGADSFSYTASDGNGGTATATVNVSVTQNWDDLAFEDFENGFGTYTDGGNDASLYTGGNLAHQGSNAANLQDNSGIASSIELTDSLDLDSPGYTELKIEFWFQAVSFESGEDFWLQYFDGTNWQTISTWTRGVDFQNGQFYFAAVEISEQDHTFSTDAKIRLVSDAAATRMTSTLTKSRFRRASLDMALAGTRLPEYLLELHAIALQSTKSSAIQELSLNCCSAS